MMSKSSEDKVLILTQFSQSENKQNMNQYQRIFYGSEYADIKLLIRRKHTASCAIGQRVTVHKAPVHNRVLFLLYAIVFGIWIRFQGVDVVLTEPSKYALAGFALKYLAGYFWVMDVWDPVWKKARSGDRRIKLRNRFVFWIMSCADLFLLSCLPKAAKHIKLRSDRSVQLYNAIDLSGAIACALPNRSKNTPFLDLALARYRLGEKEGFYTVLEAAEQIQHTNAHIRIHLIGHLDDGLSEVLIRSSAANLFRVHGFIAKSRQDFFRSVHVGLVPYLSIEDMSYIFPIKVLEHLSQGNVVIASNLPGLSTMIQHEYNGLLFEPGNSGDLAECILRLYTDFAFWRRLSTNAIESIKRYDPIAKNRTIFEEISKRKNGTFRK